MKTSVAGLAFIARAEGTVLHVYIDAVGVPTIGVGHALRPGESFPGGITQEQAVEMLGRDVVIAEKAVNDGIKVTITQNMFDACVSFTYNCGTGAFLKSNLLKKLNAGDMHGAADEFLNWVHGGGRVLQGLVNRRKAEREVFLTEVPSAKPVPQPLPPVVVDPPMANEQPAAAEPAPAPIDPIPATALPAAPVVSAGDGTVPAWKSLLNFIIFLFNAFFKKKP